MLDPKYVRELHSQHLELIGEFGSWMRSHRTESTTHRRVHYAGRVSLWAQRQDKLIWDLDHLDLANWLSKAIGPKPNTKASAKASVSKLFAWGIEANHVPFNPVLKLPPIRRPRGVPRPCPEQILHLGLSNATRRKDVLMLLLPTYGGLHAGEIARLHTRDCYGGFMRIVGKGSHQRDVPIHPILQRIMDHFEDGYFFPSDMSLTGHVLPESIGRRVRDLLKTHGWNAHTLRHRFATEIYGKDPDLLALKDLLGHASVSTTEIYTKTKPIRLVEYVKNLPDMADAASFETNMLALP